MRAINKTLAGFAVQWPALDIEMYKKETKTFPQDHRTFLIIDCQGVRFGAIRILR